MTKPARSRSQTCLTAAGAIAVAMFVAGCQPLPTNGAAAAAASGDTTGGASVLNVADAAISGNDPQMALKVSQSVLSTNPKDLDAIYHEGEAYYAMGRCEDAVAAYKVALSIDPNSSDAQTGIGRCELRTNAAEAEIAFTAAVQDNPSNAAALNDLGIARDLQGKYAAATQPYEQALMVDPGTESTEVNLGMSLALSGDPTDALQYLGPLATGQETTPKIREDYAAALIAAGRNSEAQQVLSIDLSANQVTDFMNGITTAIQEAQANPAPAPATAAPVSTTAVVTPVTTAPIDQSQSQSVTPSGAPIVTAPPATAAAAPDMSTPVTPASATVTPAAAPPAPTPPPAPAPAIAAAPAAPPPPIAPATGSSASSDQVIR
jgi:Flp pilus assembly protein TadD